MISRSRARRPSRVSSSRCARRRQGLVASLRRRVRGASGLDRACAQRGVGTCVLVSSKALTNPTSTIAQVDDHPVRRYSAIISPVLNSTSLHLRRPHVERVPAVALRATIPRHQDERSFDDLARRTWASPDEVSTSCPADHFGSREEQRLLAVRCRPSVLHPRLVTSASVFRPTHSSATSKHHKR